MAVRKRICHGLEELQGDLDAFLQEYNTQGSHQGRWCYGRTPMQTFLESVPLAKGKLPAQPEASARVDRTPIDPKREKL